MNEIIRKRPNRLLLAFTVITIVIYLLVCLVPFLDPGKFWFVAILGLGFPMILFLLLVCLLTWLIKRSKKWSITLLIVLLLGWQQIGAAFGFHFFHPGFKKEKAAHAIRVLTWNVSRWDEPNKDARGGVSYRHLMMDAIYLQDADILCLQEFLEPMVAGKFEKNIEAITAMGYPYHYFYPSSSIWNGVMKFGMTIFSRYPIIDSAKFSFGQTPHSEGLAYVDVDVSGKRCRVFTTHMESARIGRTGYFDAADGARQAAGSLKRAYTLRSAQAKLVTEQIKASPYPVIVCGNLGDLPNSYAYFKVSKGLNDAFLVKGAGMGATFRFFSPTLRIDYLFADKKFRIMQYNRPDLIYSDHYPIIADLQWK